MVRQLEVAAPIMHITMNELSRETWTEFLLEEPQSHPWHTWEWGDYIAHFRRRRITRLAIKNSQGDVIGLFDMTLQPAFPIGRTADSIPPWGCGGPILKGNLSLDERREAHKELAHFLNEESRRNRILGLTARMWLSSLDYGCLRQWMDMGYSCGLWKDRTFVYHLPVDESSIMKCYDHDFRNQVRQGLRRGGTVETDTPVDGRAIYALYLKSMAQAGEKPYISFKEVAFMLNSMERKFRDVYVCRYANRIAAFAICLKFNHTALYWLAGMDRKYSEIRPMNIIIDEFIRNSYSQGIRMIDFGGAPSKSLSDFKLSFGAKPVSTLTITKTFDPLLYINRVAKDFMGHFKPVPDTFTSSPIVESIETQT